LQLDLDKIKQHWTNWAHDFGDDLRATTKTPTIKLLEIAALKRHIKLNDFDNLPNTVLEVGCGNGYNCHAIASDFEQLKVTGIDFIPEMVQAAIDITKKPENNLPRPPAFYEGNVLELDTHQHLDKHYGVVFTNRCLINLNTHALQREALDQLAMKTAPGGMLILLENQQDTHGNQNRLRESIGLDARAPAEFNLFMDKAEYIDHLVSLDFEIISEDNFASLHDILLYVLLPYTNGGKVEYDHPLMTAVTQLILNNPDHASVSFGRFGQNQLQVFKKKQ